MFSAAIALVVSSNEAIVLERRWSLMVSLSVVSVEGVPLMGDIVSKFFGKMIVVSSSSLSESTFVCERI